MITELPLWEILVPNYYDPRYAEIDGPVKMATWKTRIAVEYGGLTGNPVICNSVWKSHNGELVREAMITIKIACTEEHIKDIMAITAEHFSQEAVFVTKLNATAMIYSTK